MKKEKNHVRPKIYFESLNSIFQSSIFTRFVNLKEKKKTIKFATSSRSSFLENHARDSILVAATVRRLCGLVCTLDSSEATTLWPNWQLIRPTRRTDGTVKVRSGHSTLCIDSPNIRIVEGNFYECTMKTLFYKESNFSSKTCPKI